MEELIFSCLAGLCILVIIIFIFRKKRPIEERNDPIRKKSPKSALETLLEERNDPIRKKLNSEWIAEEKRRIIKEIQEQKRILAEERSLKIIAKEKIRKEKEQAEEKRIKKVQEQKRIVEEKHKANKIDEEKRKKEKVKEQAGEKRIKEEQERVIAKELKAKIISKEKIRKEIQPVIKKEQEVFISHSSADSKLAYSICHFLEEKGIRCWIAPRDVQGGTEYAEAIIMGIRNCKIMVVLFNNNANNSIYVKNEVERAFNYKSILIPFKIDETIPSASLELFLGSVHWLNATKGNAEDYYDLLYDNCARVLRKPS